MPFAEEVLLERFDGGANSQDSAENLQPNQSPNPRNVDFDGKTIRKAAGYTLYGTESETSPGFFLYNHRILTSTEILVKSVADKLKFYDPITSTWQLLTTSTFTAGRRWWGASFNGYFYGGNGVDNFVRWKASSWSTLNGEVLAGAATINLAAGEGARFDNSGTGMIEGDEFTWTGRSTDQLTGVSGIASTHVTGSRVIAKVDSTTYSSNPKGSTGAFFANRIFVRDDAAPTFVYFSKLADNTNPHDDLANFNIAGTGTGDAGYIILPAACISIKEFVDADNNTVLLALCADGVARQLLVTDTGSVTLGTSPIYKKILADVASSNAVAATENSLIFTDSFGVLRDIGFTDISTILRTRRLSDDIEPTLVETDPSDAFMLYYGRKSFTLTRQDDSPVNNFTVVKDTNPDAFTFYDHWQFNSLAEHANDLYGQSSINGNVYKLFDGLNAAGNSIDSSYPTPRFNFGAPLVLKTLRNIRISGYITSGCNLYVDVYFDDSVTPTTYLINGDDEDITEASSEVAVGTVTFGRGVFGGGLPEGVSARRFIAEMNIPGLTKFYTCYMVIRNNEADVDFELDKMRLFAAKCDPRLVATVRHKAAQ